MPFHGKNLRKGRTSDTKQIYLITTVTKARQPLFRDFHSARILINSIKQIEVRGLALTEGFVVMPDHLHWLMQLGHESDLSGTVKSLKGYSSYCINRHLTEGSFAWQSGFHDRAVRKAEDLQALMRYVIANPLRAGLVSDVRNYPHWDCVYL